VDAVGVVQPPFGNRRVVLHLHHLGRRAEAVEVDDAVDQLGEGGGDREHEPTTEAVADERHRRTEPLADLGRVEHEHVPARSRVGKATAVPVAPHVDGEDVAL
jgi:hypothetical protein